MIKQTEARRVVCSAIVFDGGRMVCGPRHHHCFWNAAANGLNVSDTHVQGFVDQYNEFMTREEAWEVAQAAGQIVRRVGGDDGRLFSENLY